MSLWSIPTLPFVGFLLVAGLPLPERAVAWIGCTSVGLAVLGVAYLILIPEPVLQEHLGTWLEAGGLEVAFGFSCDALTRLMLGVATWVGFLIHLYSCAHMAGDEGYRRFFAAMNLFVAAFAVLVLADNLVFLYLGWEGVGLCSYLLIGHWYRDPENGAAARKAFLFTRAGDTALLLGLFVLFWHLGSLDLAKVLDRAAEHAGAWWLNLALLLVFVGAVGKSAQLPLSAWLPDAMAGPTPVSALIHAATMVTAGVYLVARLHPLYQLAPQVQTLVAVTGATTLLAAGLSALVQTDLKRALAYSTVSQIGYMFLGLGVGAWRAAAFHLMTHAFFKALLFLAGGVVIEALEHERELDRMGGLRRPLPLAFLGFLAGTLALSALPPASGYFSKEAILAGVYRASPGLWAAGVAGAFVTALYAFRLLFKVFFGPLRTRPKPSPPALAISLPLVALTLLALAGGFVPPLGAEASGPPVAAAASGLGLVLAAWLWWLKPELAANLARSPWLSAIGRLLLAGWGLDALYRRLFVSPWLALARNNRRDFLNLPYAALVTLSRLGGGALLSTQNGRLRWYAMGLAAGAALFAAWELWP